MRNVFNQKLLVSCYKTNKMFNSCNKSEKIPFFLSYPKYHSKATHPVTKSNDIKFHNTISRNIHFSNSIKFKTTTSAITDVTADTENSDSQTIINDTIEFLKEDLKNLFEEKGIDSSRYDDEVEFQDPITSYKSIQGYKFNISFLKNIFSPKLEVHDIKQTGAYEITTRWTMTVKLEWIREPLRSLYFPQVVFTGLSIYGINPKNGKINKHIDLWDNVDNQQFFSPEAMAQVFRQLLDITRTPNLETPNYKVLKKYKSYEVREYQPFLVAQTTMDDKTSVVNSFNPASRDMGLLFNRLAEYIFGGNKTNEKMEMTTPVFTDTSGKMQFVIGSKFKDENELPEPLKENVERKEVRGGLFAVSTFNGLALESQVTQEYEKLKKIIKRDNMVLSDDWVLARYNDPFTNPIVRRNEILIPIDSGFSLW